MDEQNYREYTKVLKESGIPLDMQKYFQKFLDQEYYKGENILQREDFKEGSTVEFANQK